MQTVLDCSQLHPACTSCSTKRTAVGFLTFSRMVCRGCASPGYKLYSNATTSTCGEFACCQLDGVFDEATEQQMQAPSEAQHGGSQPPQHAHLSTPTLCPEICCACQLSLAIVAGLQCAPLASTASLMRRHAVRAAPRTPSALEVVLTALQHRSSPVATAVSAAVALPSVCWPHVFAWGAAGSASCTVCMQHAHLTAG